MKTHPESALVAGGSSGIGLGIARGLAEQGSRRLHLVARREVRLRAVAGRLRRTYPHVEVHIHACDLSDEAAVRRLRDRIVARFGAPEALVHSAGSGELTTLSEERSSNLQLHWNSTVVTAYHLVQAFFDDLVLQDQAWVTIAGGSPLQRWPNPALSYVTTRRALSGFADALREDLHKSSVHVLFCEPPGISEGTSYFEDNPRSLARLPLAAFMSRDGFVPATTVGRGIVRAMQKRRRYYTTTSIRLLELAFRIPGTRQFMAWLFRRGTFAPEQGGPPTGHHRRLAEQRLAKTLSAGESA